VIDGVVVILYMLGMVAIGFWGFRKADSLEDYLVAGRNVPFWMYVPVMSAVILGGASTIGVGGLGYQFGISGAWLVIMLGLGIAAVGLLIGTDLANLRAYTLGEVLERRYDRYSGTVGATIAAVYALTIAITQTISIGVVVSALFGLAPNIAIFVGGVTVIAYTALGGMWSVTITDLVQWLIMTVGMVIAIIVGLGQVGGMSGLREQLDPSFFGPTTIGGGTIVTYFLLYFLGIMIGQDIWQRVFTADSVRTARMGNVSAGVYAIFYGLGAAFLGMLALVLVPGLENRDLALPTLVLETIPTGLAGVVLAGFISAMMSTASSALLAASTLFTNDVYRRFIDRNAPESRYTAISRAGIIVFGLAMIVSAVAIGDVINALTLAYNLLTGAIFVPILCAFFWKGGTWQGAMLSIIVSSVAVVASMVVFGFASNWPIVIGLGVSLVVFVAVSLMTGPPPAEQLATWREDKRAVSQEAAGL
jgi:SSS family solute:Na+ symporter